MLKHFIFTVVFLCAFLIFLAFALEAVSVIFGAVGVFALTYGVGGRLQAIIYGAIIFEILSGFMPMYIALYVFFMRKISRIFRQISTVLIYVLSTIILWLLFSENVSRFGENIFKQDGLLFIFGLIGIFPCDILAEKITNKWFAIDARINNKGARVN